MTTTAKAKTVKVNLLSNTLVPVPGRKGENDILRKENNPHELPEELASQLIENGKAEKA